jgi:hypothetical protein
MRLAMTLSFSLLISPFYVLLSAIALHEREEKSAGVGFCPSNRFMIMNDQTLGDDN